MKTIEKLYEGNIRKKYFMYIIPLLLSSLLSQSYTLINSMMIGKFIGSHAFAATSAVSPFIELIASAFWGYYAGVGIYIASLFGKDDKQKMINVIKANFLIMTTLAVLIAIICNVWHKQIFDMLNIGEDIRNDVYSYFSIYMVGLIIFQLNHGLLPIAHALGLTKISLITSTFSGITNVVFNYIFMAILKLGVGGCAIASIISQSLTASIYIVMLLRAFKNMGIDLKVFKFDKFELTESLSYGVPTLLQQITMTSSSAIVSPLTNSCGTAAISGLNIANKAKSLVLTIYQNSNKANTNFVAQAMGGGRIDKIKEGIKIGITQTLSLFIPVMLLFMIFARGFAHLFLDPVKDAASIEYGVNIIRYLLPFIFFNVFNNLFHGIFRATGSGKIMFISTLVYTVTMVIASHIFYYTLPLQHKIYGVYLGFAAGWVVEAIFATVIYISGIWKTPRYIEMENMYETQKS